MGAEIQQERFTPADFARFRERVRDGLVALEQILARPGFGAGPRTLGAELELFLIDGQARPLRRGHDIVERAADPLITHEMGSFDIELGTPPTAVAGRPLSKLREQMARTIQSIRDAAALFGGRVVPISILPTFRRADFGSSAITDRPRYRALAAGMRRLRRAPFQIEIDGPDPLQITAGDVAMEGANCAFQIHLRAGTQEFASLYNAALMLAAPVLAAAANSPTFLGHRLWHETRVALFKQAADVRPPDSDTAWFKPGRVGLGSGWVRDGALELFKESAAMHEPLLPVVGDEDPIAVAQNGESPKLDELRMHHGTVWTWNRAVYDPADGGHLRIELRALPAGPTLDDMLANTGFLLGAILGLAPSVNDLLPSFPFGLAERNFYQAAQFGLDAELVWPRRSGTPPEPIMARDLLRTLLPLATTGLEGAGIERDEIARFLGIFEARVASGVTGAVWQLRTLAALEASGLDRDAALVAMTERYLAASDEGSPVHRWPIIGPIIGPTTETIVRATAQTGSGVPSK